MKNCRLLDSDTGQIIENGIIVVDDDQISAVHAGGDYNGDELGDRALNMAGYWVLPGLWDMHVHLAMTVLREGGQDGSMPSDTLFSYRRALAFANEGVTSLRLVGTPPGGLDFAIRDGINRGDYIGPRILTAGAALASTGGHGYRGGEGCDGPYEFRKAARERLWQGADLLKVMVTGGMGGRYEGPTQTQTLRDEVQAAVEVAHNAAKHVAGHIASSQGAIMCAQVGVDTVEHGYALDEEALSAMKQHGATFVPTTVVTHDVEYWQDLRVAPWAMDKIRRMRSSHREAVSLALGMGVNVAVGTDLPTAYMDGVIVTVREMEVLVELGATPTEVIRAATEIPAARCGLAESVGRIAPGYAADLIAVAGNPYQNISALHNVSLVMARGGLVRDEIPGHTPVKLPAGFISGPC